MGLIQNWVMTRCCADDRYGNLVGDIFWTIEPAVCLWLPKILQRARGKRGQPKVLPAPKPAAK